MKPYYQDDLVTLRLYENGSLRIRVDHPSDDPEVEMAMAGRMIRLARELFAPLGIDMQPGPVNWRSDPPKSDA